MRDRQLGFTLIEVMVVVALMIVLVGLSGPGFVSATRKNSAESLKSSLIAAIKLARSEAIVSSPRTRGYPTIDSVNVCASSNYTSCTGEWGNGWIVYIPSTNYGSAPAEVLRVFKADSSFTITSSTGLKNIAFRPTGFPSTNGTDIITTTFTINDPKGYTPDQTLTLQTNGSAK